MRKISRNSIVGFNVLGIIIEVTIVMWLCKKELKKLHLFIFNSRSLVTFQSDAPPLVHDVQLRCTGMHHRTYTPESPFTYLPVCGITGHTLFSTSFHHSMTIKIQLHHCYYFLWGFLYFFFFFLPQHLYSILLRLAYSQGNMHDFKLLKKKILQRHSFFLFSFILSIYHYDF